MTSWGAEKGGEEATAQSSGKDCAELKLCSPLVRPFVSAAGIAL